jgi:hypothetical protein
MYGVPRYRLRCLPVGVALAALILAGCADTTATEQASASDAGAPGAGQVDDRSQRPWPLASDVAGRVAAAGLDLGPMGTAEHYHPHLRIVIDGHDVPVPGGIGIDPSTGAMSALHTHEPDGTLHVEAHTVGETFTLGQLFTQWGVQLTSTQVGGVVAKDGHRLTVLSNGSTADGDPARLRLEPDQQIVLQLGEST